MAFAKSRKHRSISNPAAFAPRIRVRQRVILIAKRTLDLRARPIAVWSNAGMGRGTLPVYVCVMVASDKVKIGEPVEILETLALACAEQRRASANMAASETENPARGRVFHWENPAVAACC